MRTCSMRTSSMFGLPDYELLFERTGMAGWLAGAVAGWRLHFLYLLIYDLRLSFGRDSANNKWV